MNIEARPAGLVLCGGYSRRMGQEKYRLQFGEETLLGRICRIVATVVTPVVVVSAARQQSTAQVLVQSLPSVRILVDKEPDLGPLAGIAYGLQHLSESLPEHTAVFVASCDAPLLKPQLIQRMCNLVADPFDAVVLRNGEFLYPLCAVYRVRAAAVAEKLLKSGERRAKALAPHLSTRWVTTDEILDADPELDSLRNCNTPEDLQLALLRSCEAAST
jgi:molybdopterin-guanine dinucleotide biosynthesis protein A